MASSSSSSRREPASAHGDLAGLRCLGSECGSSRPETAADYVALSAAVDQIERAGGGAEDFERLLRRPAEAGAVFATMSLAGRLDWAGRARKATCVQPIRRGRKSQGTAHPGRAA
jgi:hypothetical protein